MADSSPRLGNEVGILPGSPWRIVKYEADSHGRMYAHYGDGSIYPARSIMSRFAGRSDITPQEFEAEKRAAKDIRGRAKRGQS